MRKPAPIKLRDRLGRSGLHVALAAAAAFAVYANSLQNPYLWDDVEQIQNNAALRDWRNIPKLLTRGYYYAAREESYRPVDSLSLIVTQGVLGPRAGAQRAVNAGLHALNAALVYFLALSFLPAAGALLAALIFAVHPVHTEVVNCVAYRDELWACLLYLAAFILARRRRTAWALAAYGLSLAAKETAVTLPALFLAHEILFPAGPPAAPPRLMDRAKTILSSPFLMGAALITAVYLPLRFTVLANVEHQASYPGGSLTSNFLTMTPVLLQYVRLLFIPVRLAVSYDVPALRSAAEPAFLGAAALLGAAILGAVWRGRTDRQVAFWSAWIILGLAPVLNFVPFLHTSLMFERYLYIPSVGLAMLLARAAESIPKRAALALAVALLTAYAYATVARNRVWRDGEALYKDNLRIFPNNHRIYTFLGGDYLSRGQFEPAIAHFEKSLRLAPGFPSAFNALGTAYYRQGRYAAAIENYEQALRAKSDDSSVINNLCMSYFQNGQVEKALETAQLEMRRSPSAAEPYGNLIYFYRVMGKHDLGLKTAEQAFSQGIYSPEIHDQLGILLAAQDRGTEAIAEFEKALALDPLNFEIKNDLGAAHANLGQFDLALREFEKARKINPAHGPTRRNMAMTYWKMGRREDALRELDQLMDLSEEPEQKEKIRSLKEMLTK